MPDSRRPAPFYQFISNPLPTSPGAMIYGFESEMLAWRPMLGPAIAARQQFASVFPAPSSYQAVATAWLAGLTGVVHGQNALQPLINPYGSQ